MKIYIENIAEKLENINKEYKTYLNKKNGKFIVTKEKYINELKEENNLEKFEYKQWEKRYIDFAKEVVNNSEDYIELPVIYEIDEISVMRDFANSMENEEYKNIIIKAISEEGAIRRFKDTTENLDIVDRWKSFRSKVYYRIAIDLCKKEGVEYFWLNRNNSEL